MRQYKTICDCSISESLLRFNNIVMFRTSTYRYVSINCPQAVCDMSLCIIRDITQVPFFWPVTKTHSVLVFCDPGCKLLMRESSYTVLQTYSEMAWSSEKASLNLRVCFHLLQWTLPVFHMALWFNGILSMELTSTRDINKSVDRDHRDIEANEWKFSRRIY